MAGKVFKKFLPLFDQVLVERYAAESVSKGQIKLPGKSQGKVVQVAIVATGPGTRSKTGGIQPIVVTVDEKVLLPEYGCTKVILEEKEYYLFRDGAILGKFIE